MKSNPSEFFLYKRLPIVFVVMAFTLMFVTAFIYNDMQRLGMYTTAGIIGLLFCCALYLVTKSMDKEEIKGEVNDERK